MFILKYQKYILRSGQKHLPLVSSFGNLLDPPLTLFAISRLIILGDYYVRKTQF